MIRASLQRFLKFACVGVAGLLVDLAVLYALAPGIGWYAGRVASFIAAASVTYQLNRRWTFADRAASSSRRGAPYFAWMVSMLGGAALNYAVYVLTIRYSGWSFAPAAGVALGSIAGLGANFLSAHLIFRPAAPRA